MKRLCVGAWFAVLACGSFPVLLNAQLIPGVRNSQCHTCQQPTTQCQCQVMRPVVQTQLRPQQVMTYRDIVETQIQHQQYVEQVPVTTYKNVVVDEGGYQMVYVPKPVTKQVPQTVMTQQMRTREVPVQTVRRVPQVTTQMVPVQTVVQVPQTVTMQVQQPAIPAPLTMMAAPAPCAPCRKSWFDPCGTSCNTSGGPQIGGLFHSFPPGMANGMPVLPAPQFTSAPPMISAPAPMIQTSPAFSTMPATPTLPAMPTITVPTPPGVTSAPGAVPVPPLHSTDRSQGEWTTIAPRTASKADRYNDYGDFDPAHAHRPVPRMAEDSDAVAPNPRTSGLFVPAPSAASVWQSRGGVLR